MNDAVVTREGRATHTVGRYIDTITSGSGKIKQLERCLDLARSDVAAEGYGWPALKKHAYVFTSRPGIALIIAAKPTLFIATVSTCGTGINSLRKANHGILFDLPFIEADTELWAEDSEAEVLINERHEKRTKAFAQVLGYQDRDSSSAGGSAGSVITSKAILDS
ncbi:hypothetical protein QBC46DRAFT_346646 [Diplogelasinospora grovesii]|uniref:Uncharacterized protein n=1 Tax=Diplogelasinospora grovesii TaxID=303347 RepID=A0AAN6MXN0_9PEZI|nr:hypothetical protein QBC46DRAFT_346646 [Diplogelasinospora grovesii]